MAVQFRATKNQAASATVRDIFWRRPTIISRALELSSYVLLAIGMYVAVEFGTAGHYLFVFGLFWLYGSLEYLVYGLESEPIYLGTLDVRLDVVARRLSEYNFGIRVLVAFQVVCLATFFLSPMRWPFHEAFVYGVVCAIPVIVFIRALRDRDAASLLAGDNWSRSAHA